MPRSRYRFFETESPYFMTCTIAGWLLVFTRPESVAIVLESWKYLQSHDAFRLFGYVILENHLHLIASAPDLATVMKRFKSHTAKQIIELLESRRAETLMH
jgi:REP element-mobilizing transposase RayT